MWSDQVIQLTSTGPEWQVMFFVFFFPSPPRNSTVIAYYIPILGVPYPKYE